MEITDYDQWEEMVYEWETVEPEKPCDQSRWKTFYEKTVKSPDGKFYYLYWESGSTEQQDMPWEDMYHSATRVFPKEVTTTIYVTADKL